MRGSLIILLFSTYSIFSQNILTDTVFHEVERKELYQYVKSTMKIDLSRNEPPENKIQEIFSTDNLGTLNALGKFIKHALQKRENTICHIVQ